MTEPACVFSRDQTSLVEQVIREHCDLRGWGLRAVTCRTNHVHVVVETSKHPAEVRDQLKAWCTRALAQQQQLRDEPVRKKWWTERGSQRFIGDEASLEAVIEYVELAQDRKERDL
ncbi:MAG: transposase [Pirellulaceae bacterium]